MKKALHILLMLALFATAASVSTAQIQQTGKVTKPTKTETPKCKTCGKTIDKCQYKGKHPAKCKTCGKTVDKCKYGGKHPKCPTCGRIIDDCQYGGYHPRCSTCGKEIENCQYGGKHPSEQDLLRNRVLRELEANMVWVDGGTFTMGDKWSNKDKQQVTLSGFYICQFEVTQELWQAVMGTNIRQQLAKYEAKSNSSGAGLYGEGADYPMYYLSWDDCQDFITKLNQLTGKRYRLPTEAEWEYAARGGRLGANRYQAFDYSGAKDIDDVAWYKNNSGHTTHFVGQKLSNELGIYDMSGNVSEWCQDWYDSYNSGTLTDPSGPSSGKYRVMRGGSWDSSQFSCYVIRRNDVFPSNRDRSFGFRLAASSL